MITPFDEYPVHQTPVPLGQPASGHPDFYERYWFNGFSEDLYFAVALGVYPNREIIDAAFSVVHGGVQRSVFYSGRLPIDRRSLRAGPLVIDIVEPFAVNEISVDAPDQQLKASLTYTARTPVIEEARQTRYAGPRLWMDSTRATQFGTWQGTITCGDDAERSVASLHGVKDRSWGIRAVDATAAAKATAPQVFFLWAPLHFDDVALHGLVFEDADGHAWAATAAQVPVCELGEAVVWGDNPPITHYGAMKHHVSWVPGLRRANSAVLEFLVEDGIVDRIELEPVLTFRMRGAGYGHPIWKHGSWHGEHAVGGETIPVADLDNLEPANIHVQQVVTAKWADRRGIGILEQAVIGPHKPSGFAGLLDGASH